MCEAVEKETRMRWDQGAIREVALRDISDLEAFKQLEISTHELAVNRQKLKNSRSNISAIEAHQQKAI